MGLPSLVKVGVGRGGLTGGRWEELEGARPDAMISRPLPLELIADAVAAAEARRSNRAEKADFPLKTVPPLSESPRPVAVDRSENGTERREDRGSCDPSAVLCNVAME